MNRAYTILKDLQVPVSRESDEKVHLIISSDEMSKLFVKDYLEARSATYNVSII